MGKNFTIKTLKHKGWIAGILLLLTLGGGAPAAGQGPEPVPPLPDVAADAVTPDLGKRIYFKTCQVCHGERGDGKTFAASVLNPPPRDFTSPRAKRELSRERMHRSVTEGRKGTAMMPWKNNLSESEIRAVVAFIRENFMGARD